MRFLVFCSGLPWAKIHPHSLVLTCSMPRAPSFPPLVVGRCRDDDLVCLEAAEVRQWCPMAGVASPRAQLGCLLTWYATRLPLSYGLTSGNVSRVPARERLRSTGYARGRGLRGEQARGWGSKRRSACTRSRPRPAWPYPRWNGKRPARPLGDAHGSREECVVEERVLWSFGLALLLQPALAPDVPVDVEGEALVRIL